MADVHLWPYGNAHEKQGSEGWEFTCQHGPHECLGNTIQACALKYITDVLAQETFFVCVETHA
jgi:interferon gamma-inducible protein 30